MADTTELRSGSLDIEHLHSNTTHTAAEASCYIAPTIDHNHPLYVHPNDTPGNSLISIQLTGSKNYAIWRRFICIGLLGKNKLGFIDGRFPKSKFSSELLIFRRNVMLWCYPG